VILTSLLLLALAILGAPLFAIIGAGALLGYARNDIDLTAVPIEIFGIAETPVLLAIPLFTFAGYVLSEGRAASRLVRLSAALVGWLPGGLAMVAVVTCSLFTAFTGGSGVTIIALGALLYPALIQAGYQERFTLGLITSSGSLGLLFAPSLPLILYGIVAEVSIDDLFVAGILPGVLMMLVLFAFCLWANRANRRPLGDFSWAEVAGAVRVGLGTPAAGGRARWHLQRHPGRLRGRGGHGGLRAVRRTVHPPGGAVQPPAGPRP
jgi:tripartite ATP-independent transporter DctM subunit